LRVPAKRIARGTVPLAGPGRGRSLAGWELPSPGQPAGRAPGRLGSGARSQRFTAWHLPLSPSPLGALGQGHRWPCPSPISPTYGPAYLSLVQLDHTACAMAWRIPPSLCRAVKRYCITPASPSFFSAFALGLASIRITPLGSLPLL